MTSRTEAMLRQVAMVIAMAMAGSTALSAQETGTVMPLYEEGEMTALGVPETQVRVEEMGETLIFNVSNPTLELVRPAQGPANGTAVIVAPGGGFVAIDELLPKDSVRAFVAWRASGVPAELHIYDQGGHGFDLRPKGATSDA
jgi:acetyl esterase/lipase